jgi:hypothetical protein
MLLEAQAAGCFSTKFVLKRDGRSIGKYEGRWLSENMEIHLTERRHLEFRKIGWLSSRFELVDPEEDQVVGACDRSGFFSSTWEMVLSKGPGRLEKLGWFNTAYRYIHDGETLATVNRLGLCTRGWSVEGSDYLTDEDLLLIGLVYHTIQQREAQQQQAGGHIAGT